MPPVLRTERLDTRDGVVAAGVVELDDVQRLVLDPLNKHVIPKLVRYNFGSVPASAYPRLAAGSMAENAREVFAERVFRAALPAVQLAAAPWAQRTAQVWEHGSSEHGAPLVAKGFPPVRSFRDVGQVDFEGDAIIFDVSDR
jgi:hypothetical protein